MIALTPLYLLVLAASGMLAGFIGSLLGIGGGIVVVPLLTLGFGVDIKIAIASSLIAVVATSTAAGSVYVGKGLANMRLGMVLEIATTIGAISGVFITVLISPSTISAVFSVLMVITAGLVFKTKDQAKIPDSATQAQLLTTGHEEIGVLGGSFFDPYLKQMQTYKVERVFLGSAVSLIAGIVSGMLGIGGGFLKVPAMNLGMKVPMKVATATSNFMIGVTAISSLFVYFSRGYVYPMLAGPVAIGVVSGALYGTKISQKISPGLMRKAFAFILIGVAIQMFLKSIGALHAN